MKKGLMCATCLFLMALVGGGYVLMPEDAQADPLCVCVGPLESTLVHEGRSKNSCNEANNLAQNAALREANIACAIDGACVGPNLIEVFPCQFLDDWDYVAKWRAEYKCWVCH